VQVLNRRGLEQTSCECHGMVRLAYGQLGADAVPWARPQPQPHLAMAWRAGSGEVRGSARGVATAQR
jgi:hypothetical protein